MPINQNEIVDLLYKKIAFNSAKTDTQASRSASEEPIVSPVSAYGNHVWVSAGLIPGTPPGADSLIVKRQQSSDTEHIQLSVNPDVATHRSWLALTTGNASQMLNWIPPIFGSQYGLKVWVGDPTQAGSYRIYSKGTGADDQFYFDYNAGSLHFIGQNLPAGINAGSQIYIEGYRYVGSTDLSNLQATALNDLSDVTVDSIGLTDGQVLQWSQTQNQWISGPVSGGAMQDFLITPPKQTGQTLVYEAVNASGVGVNKFKNEFLNYAYLDGLPGATNAHAGSFLKATASGTATNPSVMELEWQPLTDLYTPLGVIDIVSSNIFHLDASRATDLDPTSPATGQDVIVTTDPSRTELPDNSSYDPNRHGAKYLADPNLWVMKTTELDKHGHVLGRVWTNLTDTLDGYVEQGDYDTKWASHESGGMPRHNIWTHLDGVHAQTQSALAREKLLIKNEDDLLYPLDHPGIIISSNAITEIHGTHVAGKAIPDSSSAPSDLDILAFSQAQNAWVLSSIASGAGEANEGISLSATDTDSFNIYKDKDLEFLRFRGIKVFDGNDIAVTDWDHTWDNGVIPDADFPFLVRENPSNGNTIEFKFDASKIKIYELGDRLAPSNVGYTIQQLEDWSSAEPLINPPNSGTGANTVQGRAYAEGWFSNPVDSSTPNEMTQLEWAALMGGGIATDDSNGRRLRTSQRVWHSPTNTYLPTSIQQQIDDKLQFKFFKDHFTLGNRAPEVRNLNFGGYYSTMSNYGSPGIVETTEGLENPIYEGVGWAHESKSILFDATEIKHAGEASGWGFTYNNNWGTATSPEWANHGIHKWNYGGGDETYNTVKSVITRHILTHEGNPHAVTHLEVGSETAQWNANKIQDANVTVSDLENNDVLVWDGSGWINSDILTQGGEQNQAVNIGSGEGLYTNRSGHYLQFKGLSSSNTKLVLNATADNIEFEIDETQIDITNLMNFPIDINQLGDVSGAPSDGDVLTYNGSEWVPAEPGTADFVYDGTGVDEDFLLRAQEVMDPFTGLSQSPKKWKWIPSDKYTTANKLAGLAHSVSGIIQTGDLSIDYEDIADGHIMKWNGASWVAAVNPAVTGAGEINRIGSWADTDLGALQSSSGTTLACTTVTLGDGTVLDVSKQSVDVDSVSTMRLMVKTVVPTAYISIDTAVSNAKEIGFTLDETQIQLDNLSGDLDPMRISPNTVNTQAFGALVGYNGMNIKGRFENVETDISNLETNKLDVTTFNLHTAYDTSIRPTDYKVGYGPIVNPGNTFGQTYIPNDAELKHQPYEIGHNKPVFNASRIMNAPVDEAFIISDGNIGASTLDMADAGKYMQWDGYKWTIGGGGEISTGEHMQFAYYHAHTPAVNATTQILKPVGNVLNFVEGTGLIESKLGMHTTTPHASFSIAGSSPSLGLKQIGNAINEPDLEAGWGTLYARSSAGGITAESIIIMHFDGADGGNAFLNYGNADLFFLPQHDPDGNGIYDSVNNVRTKAERNIYGGTSGFFPGGVGDYLAAPAVDQINLAKKPFSIDFWMCPTVDTPGEQLSGKQYLCGQFDAIHSYWYLAINYEKDDTPTADVHSIELTWKEYDAATTTAYLHTRSLTRFSSDSFTPDTWYHIVFQRIPFGSSTDTWQLLIAEAPAGHQTGVPTSASMGLPHTISEIGPVVQLDIDDYDSDFLIGNFCRQEAISTGNDFDSFKGYLDEFRFQIGTYINWEGLSVGGYYLSYLLPYDTGNSALIFKDDLGTYDLLNSAGIVRRLTDQDGDTRLDLDTKDSNDNTIRFITSAVEIASFSQLGMCLSNDDVRVSSIKDDLNNSFSSALVTQRAVKEALDSISTKSIEDAAGTTYVHTEETLNDQAIRMTVGGNEKLVIDSTSINLKAPLKAYGTLGAEGEVLIVAADGSLEWGTPSVGNVDIGYSGTVTMYADDNDVNLAPAAGLTWNSAAGKLTAKELEIEKLKVEEGISQPGFLRYRYANGTRTYDHLAPYSTTNPSFPVEGPSTVDVWPKIDCPVSGSAAYDSRGEYCTRFTAYWHCQESGKWTFRLHLIGDDIPCYMLIDGVPFLDATADIYNASQDDFYAVKGKIYAIEVLRCGPEGAGGSYFSTMHFQWMSPSHSSFQIDVTSIFETHYPVLEAAGSKRDLHHTFEVPKVGIGTNEPTEALEVIGKIKATTMLAEEMLAEEIKSDHVEIKVYSGEPFDGCSPASGAAKFYISDGDVTPVDSYTSLLLHFDEANTVTNPHHFNHVIAGSLRNTVTGNLLDVTHTNTDSGNHGLHSQGFTSSSKFGANALSIGWCDYIKIDTNTELISALDFGSRNFTIDFWLSPVPFTNASTGERKWWMHPTQYTPAGIMVTSKWQIRVRTSGHVEFYFVDSGNTHIFQFPSETNPDTWDVWNHWAFVRNADSLDLYINGRACAKSGTTTIGSLDIGIIDSADTMGLEFGTELGGQLASTYIDELRISKDIARWTENFSCGLPWNAYGLMKEIPEAKVVTRYNTLSLATKQDLNELNNLSEAVAPTGSLMVWGGSTAPSGWLLADGSVLNRFEYASLFSAIGTLHGAGNNPSAAVVPEDVLHLTFDNDFTDSSNSSHNVTTTGAGVGVSSDQVKLGLKSCAFNIGGATTNGLSVPPSTDWDFGTGDFTIEFWVYYNGLGYSIFFNRGGYNAGGVCILGGANGNMYFFIDGDWVEEPSNVTNATDATWHHYALVRESGNARIYRDGQETANKTMAGDINDSGATGITIGSGDATNSFAGYMDQIVVAKGLCKYTSNFSVVSPNTFNLPNYNNSGLAGPQTYIIKT